MEQLLLFPLPTSRAALPLCPCLSREARMARGWVLGDDGVLRSVAAPTPTLVEDAFWSSPAHVHACPDCYEDRPCGWATCDTFTTEEDPHTLRGLPTPCRCCSDPCHPLHPCEICR